MRVIKNELKLDNELQVTRIDQQTVRGVQLYQTLIDLLKERQNPRTILKLLIRPMDKINNGERQIISQR